MKTFWKILLYLLGFPVICALVYLQSRHVIEQGASYGIMAYGGVLLSVGMLVLYLIVGLITWGVSRKAKTRKGVRAATIVLVAFALILTSGVWITLDKVFPDILDDATSGTISYEDVREDYDARADYHRELLDNFIKMNVANGNLKSMSEDEYLAEGFQNQEVKDLIGQQFASLDKDGYVTFTEPWLTFATSNRMTIQTVVHLIVDEREIEEPHTFLLYGEGRTGDDVTAPVKWTIMDMQEGEIEIDLSGVFGIEGVADYLQSDAIKKLIGTYLPDLLEHIDAFIAEDSVAGSPIYIELDLDAQNLTIVPASESRGVHDYMHMAWFNSNDLLFLVISLFPARNVFLFYSAILVVLSLAIGIIRERQYKKNFEKKEIEAKKAEEGIEDEAFERPTRGTPYVKTCISANKDLEDRLFRGRPVPPEA